MKAIVNGKIITEDKLLSDMVLLFDEKIEDIIPKEQLADVKVDEVFNANEEYVSPGFIDIHTHGAVKCDVMDAAEKAMDAIREKLPSFGVTGYLPTTMTMEWPRIEKALSTIESCARKTIGTKILGCNLEGPFISKKYCGAHIPEYILDPDFSLIEPHSSIIKLLTIAPELPNSKEFIRECVKHNIVVSVGHSDASFDIVKDAIKNGAKSATHTYNAMSPLHHRKPGVVGAVLGDDDIYCELIADNIHVHPGAQYLLFKAKGIDKVILITDSMRAAAMGKGVYDLGGQQVFVDETSARLKDGTLAGSILTINTALRNFKNNTGISTQEVIKTVTANPSKLLGIYERKGSIEIGKDADIVIFNENFEIRNTFVEGTLCYSR